MMVDSNCAINQNTLPIYYMDILYNNISYLTVSRDKRPRDVELVVIQALVLVVGQSLEGLGVGLDDIYTCKSINREFKYKKR